MFRSRICGRSPIRRQVVGYQALYPRSPGLKILKTSQAAARSHGSGVDDPEDLTRCLACGIDAVEGRDFDKDVSLANHLLPDEVVDIFWSDLTIQAVEDKGRWRVSRQEIVRTSCLKFQGVPLG